MHELAPGDLVHVGAPHREEAVLDLDVAAASTYPPVRLPEDGPLERWLFVSVGAVALVAAHDARIKLGDHVAVVGLGAIGLLLVQMARLAGRAPRRRVDPVRDAARARARARRRRGVRPARRRRPARRSSARRAAASTWPSRRRARPPACTTRWPPRARRDRRHRRLLPGRRARAAARRGVAPQPARHGLEHGRLGRAAPRVPGVGPPARAAHGGRSAGLGRGARGRAARPSLPLRAGRRRVRLAR